MSIFIKTILVLLCIQATSLYGQLDIAWDVPIEVAPSQFGNTKPRIVLNGNKEPVVVFGKNTGELYLTKMVGAQFSSPQQLATNGMAYVTYWTSADIGAKGDTIFVVFKTLPLETGPMYLVRSFDGGATLSDTMLIDHQQAGVAWLPSLEVDQNGQPHVVYMGHDQNWLNPNYYLLHSDDYGSTFEGAMNLTASIPDEACDCCPAELVISDDKQILLYRNNANNLRDIYGVYSANGGQNFQSSTNVENLNWFVTSCPSTAPDGVVINDTLWSVAASKASGAYRIYLSASSLDAQITAIATDSLQAPAQLSANQNHPRIAASQSYVASVWHENQGSNYDVFAAIAPSNAPSYLYNSKILVNDLSTGSQINSDVVLNNDIIHVVYQDNSTGKVVYRRGLIGQTNQIIGHNIHKLQCSPNPIKSTCKVSAELPIQSIAVVDEMGKSVACFNFNKNSSTVSIDLSSLPAAKYTLHVQFNLGSVQKSILKI